MTCALKVETVNDNSNDKEYHEKTKNQLNKILQGVWFYTASHHLLATDIPTKPVWNLDRFLPWFYTNLSYWRTDKQLRFIITFVLTFFIFECYIYYNLDTWFSYIRMLYGETQDLNVYVLNMYLATHTYISPLYCWKLKL